MGRVRQNEGGCVEQTWASLGIERGKTNLLRFLRMPSSTHTSSSKERMLCWCGETAGCLVEGAGEAGVKRRLTRDGWVLSGGSRRSRGEDKTGGHPVSKEGRGACIECDRMTMKRRRKGDGRRWRRVWWWWERRKGRGGSDGRRGYSSSHSRGSSDGSGGCSSSGIRGGGRCRGKGSDGGDGR